MKLVIVTGADVTHARPLLNLLASLDRWEPDTYTVVYDLGLGVAQADVIRALGPNRVLTRLGLEDLPTHAADLKNFAWKPLIFAEEFGRQNEMVLWLDAGNLVHKYLLRLREEIIRHGLYTPISSGTIGKWTHPRTLERLGGHDLIARQPRSGGIVGAKFTPAVAELVRRWRAAALKLEVIAPAGSSKANHRFDQAVLSILFYQHGFSSETKFLDVSTHNDGLAPAEAMAKCS